MSNDLKEQIHHLAVLTDAEQTPVTLDEVRGRLHQRDDTEPMVRPAGGPDGVLSRGAWPAVVAAAVVLVIFGVFAWVFPGDEPAPPAESFRDPMGRDVGYYVTSAIPEGFVLQEIDTLGGSDMLFLHEFEGTWLPSDGGFAIHSVFGHPFGPPEDPEDYLAETLEAVPGAIQTEVGGRPGILYETEFSQADVTAPLIWVLGIDDQGGIFEIAAAGMERDDVIAVANGVHRTSVADFLDLGSQITWDVKIDASHNQFAYSPPERVTEVADEVAVALGHDLLLSRLANSGGETTVVTTDDGEVVETFGQGIRSTSAELYLTTTDDRLDEILDAFPGHAQLSPQRSDARVDDYVGQVGGEVLSEDPYVVRAVPGPEPRFDTSRLGSELPLEPASSLPDVLPGSGFTGVAGDQAAATEDRPVIVVGTASQPNSDTPAVTILVWFTESGVTCESTTTGSGMGSGCGFEILSRFGAVGFGTAGDSSEGVYRELSYTVPLETSVVQIVTPLQSYWQRPAGGYGLVIYGDTVEQPTTIIAYDADGDEIGQWNVPSG